MSTQTSTYRETKAISNSTMGVYEDDFDAFVKYWVHNVPFPEKKDDSLSMGSAIDVLLTRPGEFEDRFIIYRGNAPTGQMQAFCYALCNTFKEGDNLEDLYQNAYDVVGFKRDNLEKVKQRFGAYKNYFEFLVNSKSKSVLTFTQAARAHNIVEELKSGEFTRKLVNIKNKPGVIEVHDQLELMGKYTDPVAMGIQNRPEGSHILNLKGALDRVIIDHEKKIVVPIDFKSSFSSNQFEYSYVKWRYYRQGSFYSHLLGTFKEEKNITHYETLPFTFVVCATMKGKHYLYQMDPNDINKAATGGIIQYGYKIKGWREILGEIAFLQAVSRWDYPYEVIKNNGVVPLKVFKHESE